MVWHLQKGKEKRKKKIKDKSNLQIKGKAGLGRNRRKLREKRHQSKFTGIPTKPQQEKTAAGRPAGLVELSKEQEKKVTEATEKDEKENDGDENQQGRSKKRRKRQAAQDAQDDDHVAGKESLGKGFPSQSSSAKAGSVEFDENGGTTWRRGDHSSDSRPRPQKLDYGATVYLTGLKSAPELNGQMATCLSFDGEKGRWYVRLKDGSNKLLKAENLKLLDITPGSTVRLHSLKGAAELNGMLGICRRFDDVKERWFVALKGGVEKLLKADNLELCLSEGSSELRISPTMRQLVTICTEKSKLNDLLQVLKQEREKQKRGLKMVSLTVVFCRDDKRVRSAAAHLTQAQLQCVAVHTELSEEKRKQCLKQFNLDERRILVITEKLATNLPAENIQSMVNFDFPPSLKIYCERSKCLSESTGTVHSLFTQGSAAMAREFATLVKSTEGSIPANLRDFISALPN